MQVGIQERHTGQVKKSSFNVCASNIGDRPSRQQEQKAGRFIGEQQQRQVKTGRIRNSSIGKTGKSTSGNVLTETSYELAEIHTKSQVWLIRSVIRVKQ